MLFLYKNLFQNLFYYKLNQLDRATLNWNIALKLDPEYQEVREMLNALKNNNESKENDGIRQTWIFAHPENKKFTGPYERFEKMILSNQYKILLNHASHKISLITNSKDNYIYNIELITKNKKMFFYEWHLEKSTTDKCDSCWFTTIVLPPVNIGNTI